MTNEEFQYWLKGFFQLEKEDLYMNEKQLWIIHNHLTLVEKVSGQLSKTNIWLKEYLASLHHTIDCNSSDCIKEVTNTIRNWLFQASTE